MSVALIGPDVDRRKGIAEAIGGPPSDAGSRGDHQKPGRSGIFIREYPAYPADHDALTRILEQDYDVIILDLDSDSECALGVVKTISTQSSATVMVYSARSDVDLVVRSMRAGAREFLNLPVSTGNMAEALARVSTQRTAPRSAKK